MIRLLLLALLFQSHLLAQAIVHTWSGSPQGPGNSISPCNPAVSYSLSGWTRWALLLDPNPFQPSAVPSVGDVFYFHGHDHTVNTFPGLFPQAPIHCHDAGSYGVWFWFGVDINNTGLSLPASLTLEGVCVPVMDDPGVAFNLGGKQTWTDPVSGTVVTYWQWGLFVPNDPNLVGLPLLGQAVHMWNEGGVPHLWAEHGLELPLQP